MDLEIAKTFGNYGLAGVCIAVLISLHIYNVRITLPELAKEGRKQIDGLVLAFKEELENERKQCHEDHEKLFEAVSGNQKAITENQVAITRLLDRLPYPTLTQQHQPRQR